MILRKRYHPYYSASSPRQLTYILQELKERQGIQCAVIDTPSEEVELVGAHIIRGSIAKQDDSEAGVVSAIYMYSAIL
jgi:hypothetical protein